MKNVKNVSIWTILLIVAVVIIVFVSYSYFITLVGDLAQTGQFGDSFGTVNAFFSACAFMAVAIALLYQVKEFKLQREYLDNQSRSIKLQNFEQSFFQLLSLHRRVSTLR